MRLKKLNSQTVNDFFEIAKKIDKETDYLLLYPHERKTNKLAAQRIINDFEKGENIGFLVYNKENICLGYILGIRRTNLKSKHVINMIIAITKEAYGIKAAFKLLTIFEKECLQEQIKIIRLSVLDNNLKAISFYLKNNFKIEGKLTNNINQNGMLQSEYSMYKTLIQN